MRRLGLFLIAAFCFACASPAPRFPEKRGRSPEGERRDASNDATLPDASPEAPAGAKNPSLRVVFISLDGWAADLAPLMPVFVELQKHGSWTLEAETPIPAVTVVSHAALFTGASPATNGVDSFEPASDKLEAWRPLKVKTIFEAAPDAEHGPAAFFQKKKLIGLFPREALHVFGFFPNRSELVEWACATIMDEPEIRLTFIHIADLDAAGHSHGWGSKAQLKAAERVNEALAELATCMHDSEEAGGPPIVLIITSDHGGHGKTHGKAVDSDRLVPFIALGPGIKADHEIAGAVRLIDVAPTILRILGIATDALPDAEGTVLEDILSP